MSNPAKPLTTLQHTIQYACDRRASDAFQQAKRDAMVALTTTPGPNAAQERRFWRMASSLQLTLAKNWRRIALLARPSTGYALHHPGRVDFLG